MRNNDETSLKMKEEYEISQEIFLNIEAKYKKPKIAKNKIKKPKINQQIDTKQNKRS